MLADPEHIEADLIGQLASAINQAAGGGSPARDFKVIAPSTPLVTAGRGSTRAIEDSSLLQ